MKQIVDSELRKIQIGILNNILDFCKNNNIRCWVVAGTALGAVRHSGFIPWDDDIDVGMPRADYERFAKIFYDSSEQYEFYDYKYGDGWYLKFGKVFDTRTETIETIYQPLPKTGVYVDVFPLDGLSNDIDVARNIVHSANKQCVVCERLFMTVKCRGPLLKRIAKHLYKVIYSRFVRLPKHIDEFIRCVTKYTYDESDYVGNVSDGMYGERQILEKRWFEHTVYLPFENLLVPVPGDYDKYLTSLYGDYMTPPPVEKQKSHHSYVAYWK